MPFRGGRHGQRPDYVIYCDKKCNHQCAYLPTGFSIVVYRRNQNSNYFLKFQEACGREIAEAANRMKELNTYDPTRKIQLKWYACDSGKSRAECAKLKKKVVCNNMHHALAYDVKRGVADGEIKLQDPKDDTSFNVVCSGQASLCRISIWCCTCST